MIRIQTAAVGDGPRLVALDRATWSPEDDGATVGYTALGSPTPLECNRRALLRVTGRRQTSRRLSWATNRSHR